jgi:hypothetical protein
MLRFIGQRLLLSIAVTVVARTRGDHGAGSWENQGVQ